MRLVSLTRAATHVRAASTTATIAAALKVGDALRPRRRRFTEDDVAAYAGVSGDRNPVHLDDAFARGTGGFQRGRVVHGMLVASLFPALIASHFPGAVYASQSLKFAAPVHVGDEVVAQVQALHIKATGGSNSNICWAASSSPPSASWTMRRLSPSTARPWLFCPRCSSAPRATFIS
ncbi:unnamed protein product [Triticum turgidum subsp. durum]|uniref:MaoC-like domain-containing protein n=1 Tax=Triticum turgidum subsp. durum TaxID=4567 RepID=A0A9R0UZA7_TRITD|nr:unnamed protein product [Triticum turgidum subsp. durum]